MGSGGVQHFPDPVGVCSSEDGCMTVTDVTGLCSVKEARRLLAWKQKSF